MKIAKKSGRDAPKSSPDDDGFTVAAPLVCNGAAAGLQRAPRCTMKTAPLQTNGAAMATKKQHFGPEKAAFRPPKVAQIAILRDNRLSVSRLQLHAQNCDICDRRKVSWKRMAK